MTLPAAYATFEERERGSIEVGKRADFTVLSADIMQIPEPEILKTRCAMTIVGGGEVVFEGNDVFRLENTRNTRKKSWVLCIPCFPRATNAPFFRLRPAPR